MKKVALISLLALTGCGGHLTCNDNETKSEVLVVIDSHLERARWFHDMKPALGDREVSGISTTYANKDLGKYSCSATYTFEYRQKVIEVPFIYELIFLEDKDQSQVLVDVNVIKDRYMTAAMGF